MFAKQVAQVSPHPYGGNTEESGLYHVSLHECSCSCVLCMTKNDYVLVVVILSINNIDYLRLNITFQAQMETCLSCPVTVAPYHSLNSFWVLPAQARYFS